MKYKRGELTVKEYVDSEKNSIKLLRLAHQSDN